MCSIKIVQVSIVGFWAWVVVAYSTNDPLKLAKDFRQLDNKITRGIRTAKREIWDKMVDDIVFFTHSLVNFQWALEQNSTGILDTALELADGGKPTFIDKEPRKRFNRQMNLTEWDWYRFLNLRMDADGRWNNITSVVDQFRGNLTL